MNKFAVSGSRRCLRGDASPHRCRGGDDIRIVRPWESARKHISPLVAACLVGLLLTHAALVAGLDFDRLLASLSQRFGPAAVQSYRGWQRLIEDGHDLPIEQKLGRVNEFFNRRIQTDEDINIWGQSDYWATPLETLGKGRGDCEDFTIAKYFSLLALDVPVVQLRLIYVKARIGGPTSALVQAHMVLAYYATPDAEPLVLDSLITEIRPASRRPDLMPVFSFNSEGIWAGAGGAGNPGGTARLSRWQQLLQRARSEGFQ